MLLRIGILFVLFFFGTGCGTSYDESAVKSRFHEVQRIAKVGTSFEAVKSDLEEAGYSVGPKIAPTQKKDYFVSQVPLVERLPSRGVLAETTGEGSGPKSYAVIYMDKDGIISKVE